MLIPWYKISGIDIDFTDVAIKAAGVFTEVFSNRPVNHTCWNYSMNRDDVDLSKNILDYYLPVEFVDTRKGDLVLFLKDGKIKHSALIFKKASTVEDTIIRAKFSNLPIYQHLLKHTPRFYGEEISFFRKEKDV
jgi:hypothetical protein